MAVPSQRSQHPRCLPHGRHQGGDRHLKFHDRRDNVTRRRTGGQKPKLGPRQAHLARLMYEETGPDGKRLHTVTQIAAEFGVSRPTVYRYLARTTASPG